MSSGWGQVRVGFSEHGTRELGKTGLAGGEREGIFCQGMDPLHLIQGHFYGMSATLLVCLNSLV